MKLHLYFTKELNIYELKVDKIAKNRAIHEQEDRFVLQDVSLANGTYFSGREYNVRSRLILPESKEEAIRMITTIADSFISKNGKYNKSFSDSKSFDDFTLALNEIESYKEEMQGKIRGDSVTLEDVIVNESIMNKLKQTLQFLNKADKYEEIGAEMPKNILLYGPSGTGKTLIAKALGHESGRKVYIASAAEFAEKYVGTGPKKIRELFEKARKHRPSIIFIDEIDCVAMKRTSDRNGEDIKMLNQLLTELDGVSDNKDITVICATNRLDMLDPAFIRTGRFDRKIKVDNPSYENRIKIFELYLKRVKHKKNINTKLLAEMTEGCSGADIKTIVNEAAILAVDRDLTQVSMKELEDKIKDVIENNKIESLDLDNPIGF